MLARNVSVIVTMGLSVWSLCFVVLGNTPNGKQFYVTLAAKFFKDPKAGVYIMNLCIPVLISASLAALFTVRRNYRIAPGSTTGVMFPTCVHRYIQRWKAGSGDKNFNQFAVLFIFVPLALYTAFNIRRHLYGNELSFDDKVMEIANSFGLMALVAFAYLLIPVARHSSLLKLLNWSPVAAIRLHIWMGRIIVLGVVAHGGGHMFRWRYNGERIFSLLTPPAQCWTLKDSDFRPQCRNDDTDCSCYDHFRNLTGFLVLVGLLVIGITSLNHIRRNYYRTFYMAHVLVAPTVLIFTILHWNKSIMYMAPSLLYYAASSAPIMVETRRKVKKTNGVNIVSVEQLASAQGVGRRQRPCMSVTFEASAIAMHHFRPGQYIKLLVPEIASNFHPFSVNKVPGEDNQLRVIFRATGLFTYKLADRLMKSTGDYPTEEIPRIHVDGFHGPYARAQQVLKHDFAVLVAGGIGITAYLSVLEEVKAVLASRVASTTDAPQTEIVLHWSCRDKNLINYVREKYLEPLLPSSSGSSFRMRLVVHNTDVASSWERYSGRPEMTPEASDDTQTRPVVGDGLPFTPTMFSPGSRIGIKGNIPVFVTFTASAWLGLWVIWYLYINRFHSHQILPRFWGALAFAAVALGIAIIANFFMRRRSLETSDAFLWQPVDREDENRIEMESIEKGGAGLNEEDDGEDVLAAEPDAIDAVTYEEKTGRPSVHDLLKGVEEAKCPGLFMCGPTQLMDDLKEAAEERCMIRIRQCIQGTPHIAIYEETFEM